MSASAFDTIDQGIWWPNTIDPEWGHEFLTPSIPNQDEVMRRPAQQSESDASSLFDTSRFISASVGSPSSDGGQNALTPGSAFSDSRYGYSPRAYREQSAESNISWMAGEPGFTTGFAQPATHPGFAAPSNIFQHESNAALMMDIDYEAATSGTAHPGVHAMPLHRASPGHAQGQHYPVQYLNPQQVLVDRSVVQQQPVQQTWQPQGMYQPQVIHQQMLPQGHMGLVYTNGQQFFQPAQSQMMYAPQHMPMMTEQQTVQQMQPSRQAPLPQTTRRQQAVTQSRSTGRLILPHGPAPPPGLTASRSANRGGRVTAISEAQRQQIAATRKTVACWRCAMQRDTCKGTGDNCDRCKHPDGPLHPWMYVLRCDRTKLPLLLGDFLPASMTHVHQKQVVMNTMRSDAVGGVPSNGREIMIKLTAGYGPDFEWPMVEFVPKHQGVMIQFQFLQHPQTGVMEKRDKYSPPFAIKSLSNEEASFERYIENILMEEQHLYDFAELCYMAESRHDKFQEILLTEMCTLFIHTADPALKDIMKKVLRMLVLTNIMVHTLTITEDSLEQTLRQLRRHPAPEYYHQKHTSPKLANQQLKFFFCSKREEIYRELLKQGQTMFRSSADKDTSWMLMFVIILGFAMVHEESQSILQIQAVSRVAKGERDEESAMLEAFNACQTIDAKFELLIALFQHKYRSDKWTSPGSFGNQTPVLQDAETRHFLGRIRELVEGNRE